MACTFYGFTIPSEKDKDNRVANAISNNTVSRGNIPLQVILADAVINKTAAEIINAVNKANSTNKNWKEVPVVENLYELNLNVLKKVLKNYAILQSKDIANYRVAHTQKALRGFNSEVALEFAKEYTADMLLDIYYEHINDKHLNDKMLKTEFKRRVERHFNDIIRMFETTAKEYIKEHEEENDIIKGFQKLDKLRKDLSEFKETNDIKNDADASKKYETLKCNIIAYLYSFIADFNNLAKNKSIINTEALQNYTALYKIASSNDNTWFEDVSCLSKINTIARLLNPPLQEDTYEEVDFDDESDYVNPEHDTDEDNGWDKNKIQSSYDKLFSNDFKIYLASKLYKVAAPINRNTTEVIPVYDTNNPLGVKMKMDVKQVYVTLLSALNDGKYFKDIYALADRIDNLAQSVPELYGFYIIADDIRKDHALGNKILQQLRLARINKTIIAFDENDIVTTHNNAGFISHITNFNNITDQIQRNYMGLIDSSIIKLHELKTKIQKLNTAILPSDADLFDKTVRDYADSISAVLTYLSPNITKEIITAYLRSNLKTVDGKKRVSNLLNNTIALANIAVKENSRFNKDYVTWKENVLKPFYKSINSEYDSQDQYAEDGDAEFTKRETPRFDYNNYMQISGEYKVDDLANTINNIIEALEDFMIVNIDLNSPNAEGHNSSNIIDNNYLTNIVQLIKEGRDKEGLEAFKELYKSCPQLKFNPIFVGIEGTQFNGLFIEDAHGNLTINEEGVKALNLSLFDGVKTLDNEEAKTYTKLTLGDYFLSQAILYFNGTGIRENGNTTNTTTFLLDTPSDGQKNFMMSISKLEDKNSFTIANQSEILTPFNNFIQSKFDIPNSNDETAYQKYSMDIKEDLKTYSTNEINFDTLYNILTGKNTIDTKKLKHKNLSADKNSVVYTVYYKDIEGNKVIIDLQGNFVDKTRSSITNIQILKIASTTIYTYKDEQIDTLTNKIPDSIIIPIKKKLLNEALKNKTAKIEINTRSDVYLGFKNLLLGELYNFAKQLNNVVDIDNSIPNEYQYVFKENVSGLVGQVHYNNKKQIIETVNGIDQLAGTFFKFTTLFAVNGFDINKELINAFSLYGGENTDSIIVTKREKDKVSKLFNVTGGNGIFTIVDGEIMLNTKNKLLINTVNNLTKKWLENFIEDTQNKLQPFNSLIEYNEKRMSDKSYSDFIRFNLVTSLARISAQSILIGSDKFYKDSRTYLKRTKGIQGNGKSYYGGNLFAGFGQEISDIIEKGKNIEIMKILIAKVDDKGNVIKDENGTIEYEYVPLTARNGFRAATVYNTVRTSDRAEDLRKDLELSFKEKIKNGEINEATANNIIDNIMAGFDSLDKATKVNDAQSYITFEEFIRRRWADGTIEKYRELINDIYAVRTGEKSLAELDVNKLNSYVQIQKNVYFDQQIDKELGVAYPRFIKNAEFVLIPELLGEHSSLRQLYDIMRQFNLDQINTLETSKAANRDVLTFWDNDGVANPERFKAELSQMIGTDDNKKSPSIENYYYRFLFKQQDVVQHMKDEYNKAGLQIVKKIIDNIAFENPDDPRAKAVQRFMDSFTSNIKNSYESFILRMGWRINENGELVNISDGSTILNFREFYRNAKLEAQRLGMDSNFLDYFDVDASGNPKMPNWLNIFSSKMEAIAQSMFNNSVTKQQLPGWHAAQVTSVGQEGVYDSTGKIRRLQYHPRDEKAGRNSPVIEILIPHWSNVIKQYVYDNTLSVAENDIRRKKFEQEQLDKLNKAGLLEQIGYRIPTEGKQSIAILKVVGFTNEAYGSTVFVPDEWVTQTGSDFDVDTIYSIFHKFRYNYETDQYEKIKELKFANENQLKAGYVKKLEEIIDNAKNRLISEDDYDEYESLGEYKSKVGELQNDIKTYRKFIKNSDKYKTIDTRITELIRQIREINKPLYEGIQKRGAELSRKFKAIGNGDYAAHYKDFYNFYIELANSAEEQGVNPEIFKEIAELLQAKYLLAEAQQNKKDIEQERGVLLKEFQTKRFEMLEYIAKKYGLLTFEEYKNLSDIDKQTRDVRSNIIIDSFLDIMHNLDSLEENLSRSNFDDITNVNDYLRTLNSDLNKLNIPVGNSISQIYLMNDAIMGARLKARSVMRDTFLSICNKSRAVVDSKLAIRVAYDLTFNPENKENPEYNAEYLAMHYGAIINGNTAIVSHDKLGWNKNNRNIVGRLITVYGSETTAHILDAVKEGAILNETEDTFGVFKTMLDLGMDYYTAIGFLAQPTITRLVEEFDKGNSIYISDKVNAINQMFVNIAKELGISGFSQYTPLQDIFEAIAAELKLSTTKLSQYKENFVLNQKELFDTIINPNNESVKHKLDVLIFYVKLNDISREIENIINLTNPDKLAAKQTIFETKRMLKAIYEKGYGTEDTVTKIKTVDGKNLIEALYPNMLEKNPVNVATSKYQSLAAFLKYSTIPSVLINSQLFDLEGEGFTMNIQQFQNVSELTRAYYNTNEEDFDKLGMTEDELQQRYLENMFTEFGIVEKTEAALGSTFTPETYRQYKEYIIEHLAYGIKDLVSPITVDENGLYKEVEDVDIIENANGISEANASNAVNYWNQEIARIYGYGRLTSTSFNVINFNAPTKEEIEQFRNLTPAQKILWLKEKSGQNVGIFEFIKILAPYKTRSLLTSTNYAELKYYEEHDPEITYNLFRAAAFNKNPLVRLAVADLVKYAYIVEGGRFKRGSIGKIITTDFLLAVNEDGGFSTTFGKSLIDNFKTEKDRLKNDINFASEEFVEKYIRSHKNFLHKVYINNFSNIGNVSTLDWFNKKRQLDGAYFISYEALSDKGVEEFMEKLMPSDNTKPYNYVLIKFQRFKDKFEQIYKVQRTNNGYYIYPLGILEEHEHTDYSVNNTNNPIFDKQNYIEQIDKLNQGLFVLNGNGQIYWQGETKLKNKINPFTIKYDKVDISVDENFITDSKNESVNKQISDNYNSPVEGKERYGFIAITDRDILAKLKGRINVKQNLQVNVNGSIENVTAVISDNGNVSQSKYREIRNAIELVRAGRAYNEKRFTNSEKLLINHLSQSPGYLQNVFLVKFVKDEVAEQELTKHLEEVAGNDKREYVSSGFIPGRFAEGSERKAKNVNDADRLTGRLAKSLSNKRDRHANDISRNFAIKVNMGEILVNDLDRLREMSKSIYALNAEYYKQRALELIEKMEQFDIAGVKKRIDSDEFFELLQEHPESYDEFLNLLLDAKNFGGEIGEFFNLDISSEDESIQQSFKTIIEYIQKVRSNSILTGKNGAIVKLFDKYIAKLYSTNPNVRAELINLRTQFGDINWFDSIFADTAELNNKQVQATIQSVYQILVKAKEIITPRIREQFISEYDEIMSRPGEFEWEHIINDGKYIQLYDENFIKERDRLKEKYIKALNEYGKYDIRTLRAKLKRDKFFAYNINQPILPQYYITLTRITEDVLNSDPETFIAYRELADKLMEVKQEIIAHVDGARERQRALRRQMSELLQDNDVMKTYFIEKRKLIEEYKKTSPFETWSVQLRKYRKIVEEYDKNNPVMTLRQKLENTQYKEAYEWIQDNTIQRLTLEAQIRLDTAFSILRNNQHKISIHDQISRVISNADAYDDYGNVDGTKFTLEEQMNIKNMITDYYDTQNSEKDDVEDVLIKCLGNLQNKRIKQEFWNGTYDIGHKYKNSNKERNIIIKAINNLYREVDEVAKTKKDRVLGENGLDVYMFVKYATSEQLERMQILYSELRKEKSIEDEEDRRFMAVFISNNAHTEYNDEQFVRDKTLVYKEFGEDSVKAYRFNQIYGRHDRKTGELIKINGILQASDETYGKLIPNDSKFLNYDFERAKRFIDNNIEDVPTNYYYEAEAEAIRNGTYEEWYNANHIYNQYTRHWEPIPIWTKMSYKQDGVLARSYEYMPTNDYEYLAIKEGKENKDYKSYGSNFNVSISSYKNPNYFRSDGSIKLTEKELAMLQLLQRYAYKYATTDKYKKYNEMYLPRLRKIKKDSEYLKNAALQAIGFNIRRNDIENWHEQIGYLYDYDEDFSMFELLKNKESKERIQPKNKSEFETEREYHEHLAEVKRQNEEIDAANYKIDSELRNENWKDVFTQLITEGEMKLARDNTKNILWLLLADLATNDAYKVDWKGKVKLNRYESNGEDLLTYQHETQERVRKVLENFAHRVMYDEYKRPHKLVPFSNALQAFTSAKFMALNVHGGVANIATGYAGIIAEIMAGDYFNKSHWIEAEAEYAKLLPSFLADMYDTEGSNLMSAIVKLMNPVDYDELLNRLEQSSTAAEFSKRLNDAVYSLNSLGEHKMQVTAAIANLKASKIYYDELRGKWVIGNINNYTRDIENMVMAEILEEYSEKYGNGEFDILKAYVNWIDKIKTDMDFARQFDNFTSDPNIDFIKMITRQAHPNSNLLEEFNKRRAEKYEEARERFEKEEDVISQFEFVPTRNGKGLARIKKGSHLTEDSFAQFIVKSRKINNKIHGVYEKLGRAAIEQYWYGNLVMQYHKHIYPGIMKRFRGFVNEGYYNEARESVEVGSYVSLTKLLFGDFYKTLKMSLKKKQIDFNEKGEITEEEITVLKSLQNAASALVLGLLHVRQNYKNLPLWEQHNVKRAIGDALAIFDAAALIMLMYAMWDDDEMKNDLWKANVAYTWSRIFSERIMWTPSGMISEGHALWDSPVAGSTGITDSLKMTNEVVKLLFGDEEVVYKNGPYKGRYKAEVLLTRNIPVYRIFKNIENMGVRNSYYNGGTSNLSAQKTLKNIVRDLQEK